MTVELDWRARQAEAVKASRALRGRMTRAEPAPLGYQLVLTCRSCGGRVVEIATGRTSEMEAVRMVKCSRRGCNKAMVVRVTVLDGSVG